MLSPPPPFCCPRLHSLLEVAGPRLHPHQLHHPHQCWDLTWSSCNTPVSSVTSIDWMCIKLRTSVANSTKQHMDCQAMHTQFKQHHKQHHKQTFTRCLLTAPARRVVGSANTITFTFGTHDLVCNQNQQLESKVALAMQSMLSYCTCGFWCQRC